MPAPQNLPPSPTADSILKIVSELSLGVILGTIAIFGFVAFLLILGKEEVEREKDK